VRAEEGQSLIIVVLAMFLIIVVAALAIDLASWYQRHHNAQVAADASALAVANYMGHGGTASTATGTATSYAASNGIPISGSNVTVNTSNETVTVTVPTKGALTFAGIVLGSNPNISARAVATWARNDCGAAGSHCGFIFAGDNICSGTTNVTGAVGNQNATINHGVTIAKNGTGSGINIQGGINSNSSITTSVNGNQIFTASAVWSGVSGCSGPSPSSPSPYSSASYGTFPPWPLNYAQIYPACVIGGTPSCKGDGFPPYCTIDSTSSTPVTITTPVTNAVYCDAGSGPNVNPSDPSTWNGTLNISTTSQGTYDATYIAGTVNINIATGSTFGPAANVSTVPDNNLLAYATACNASSPLPTTCTASSPTTTSPAVTLNSNGNATITGDIFAPVGVIDSALGGTPSMTTFLEGWDVVYNADGTVYGGGPALDSSGQFLYDYLTQ
jgi:hypothetical protein